MAIDKSARRIKTLGWRRSVSLAAAPAASRAVSGTAERPYWRQSRNLMTAVR
jgi:hypothetical protein